MKKLEAAILKTLAYADLFDHALTTEELSKFLIGYELKDINSLSNIQSSSFKHQDSMWTLTKRDELAELKKYQIQDTKYKIQQAEKFQKLFSLIPWIKMVGITGSVAGGTPTADDDIDLLIITDRNRLWLTRIILIPLLNVTGKRRKPGDDPNQVNNKLCLNMWLSIDNLEEKRHDLYTANELARLIPILNRHQTYERYMQTNAWISNYLPNVSIPHALSPISGLRSPVSGPLRLLDNFAEVIQKRIMRQPTNETIQSNRLAFHPHDYRSEIINKYQLKLIQLGISDT